jgi:hypothetical protein
MTSLAVIDCPLIIEMEAQVREQFIDGWFLLQTKERISAPRAEIFLVLLRRWLVETEVGDNWRKKSQVVRCGPKRPYMPASAVGRGRDQGTASLCTFTALHFKRRNFLKRVATRRVCPFNPDGLRRDVDQIQTGAQAIPFGVRELRGAVYQLVRKYIAQGAIADIVFEPVCRRQHATVI